MSISIAALFRLGLASAILAGIGLTSPVLAQSTVYIPAILELSGAGAVSGTNFRDGMLLAIDEINAKGGILGRKIDTPLLDTQSDAGISAPRSKRCSTTTLTLFSVPYSPVQLLVDMALTQQAEIPEIVGGEAAAITQKGRPLRLPHLVRPAVQHAENRQTIFATASRRSPSRALGEQRFRQGRARYVHQGNGRT